MFLANKGANHVEVCVWRFDAKTPFLEEFVFFLMKCVLEVGDICMLCVYFGVLRVKFCKTEPYFQKLCLSIWKKL